MKLPKLARILLLVVFLTGIIPSVWATAEQGGPAWDSPVSLTNSGSSASPKVAVTSDGMVQVFWWDQFDGLKRTLQPVGSSENAAAEWTAPQTRPIETLNLGTTPEILVDGSEQNHALWLQGEPGQKLLMHSQMDVAGESWGVPYQVSATVIAFDAVVSPTGGLSVAYLQNGSFENSPAGVYVIRYVDGGWASPHIVSSSEYFRSLVEEQGWVRIWDAGNGRLYLTWEDRRLGLALFSTSQDNGATWSEPESLGQAADRPSAPRVVSIQGGTVLRSWQISLADGCGLYQQVLAPDESLSATPKWSSPVRILTTLPTCPDQDRYWTLENELFWLWGEGSNNLSLAAWNHSEQQWSQPVNLSFEFEDSRIGKQTDLRELAAWIDQSRMIVAGVDTRSSDIWVTSASFSDFEWFYDTASAWKDPSIETYAGMEYGNVSLAIDPQEDVHIIWTDGFEGGRELSTLYYSKWNGKEIAAPTPLLKAAEGEILLHPNLFSDEKERLHLVWSGGKTGSLYHSSVSTAEAGVPSAWSEPVELTRTGVASFPQIGSDGAGNLYILYTVSLNEERGLYLIRSENYGKDWAEPHKIVDGVTSGSQMLSHPALAVHPNGSLHVAWVEAALPGTWPTRAILYSSSQDKGMNWTTPQSVAGEGFDWPKIDFTRDQIHLLFSDLDGSIWHRWGSAGGQTPVEVAWSPEYPIPDWKAVELPFALSNDGSGPLAGLYLVGTSKDGTSLLFSAWSGDRWTEVETYFVKERWEQSGGVVAVANPKGGTLIAAWPAKADQDEVTEARLYLATRSIPAAVSVVAEAPPPATPTQAATPTAVVSLVLSPTPVAVNPSFIEPQSSQVPSILVSSGLTAFVFVAAFVLIGIWNKHKS